MNLFYDYDVVVIGAGHAGTEAALAAARIGAQTALLTTNLDTVGQMSCNPAIGGVAKGQIVREIDALGGAMGFAIDRTGIQFRMLNVRKGPAMHSPRAQADKRAYQGEIKRLVETQPNLDLRQETVEDILTEDTPEGPRIVGVKVRGDVTYRCRAVVITTGTFLAAVMHTGEVQTAGGRGGEGTTTGISAAFKRLGFRVARFKTGTPPRLSARTIDYSQLDLQPGDDIPEPFSYLHDTLNVEQMPCHMAHTNEAVHELIRANLHRAPMYTGQIKSGGPRYCPSIEDKVVRFAEKSSHQIFLEPEGRQTQEVYVNGVSTSLPRDVQDQIFKMIPGLQRAKIMRYGYAVEYDFCPPDQLKPSLETKNVAGLYFAGQLNGTTGYEEAGAQGLMAGANAALEVAGKSPLILGREQGYIGVLIDDLVTLSVDEPYRMFTSRAEFRLLLRHDNADRRLTPLAREAGLIDDTRWERLQQKDARINSTLEKLASTWVEGVTLEQFLRRPETLWADVVARAPELAETPRDVIRQLEIDVKYSGYVDRQKVQVAKQQRMADKRIPDRIDYSKFIHIRTEAREKLSKVRPATLAQAGRISGITPADVALLLTYLEKGLGAKNAAQSVLDEPASDTA
jgi:tRNA uridine 5-carboxymethylaminomethyl modification enzyme